MRSVLTFCLSPLVHINLYLLIVCSARIILDKYELISDDIYTKSSSTFGGLTKVIKKRTLFYLGKWKKCSISLFLFFSLSVSLSLSLFLLFFFLCVSLSLSVSPSLCLTGTYQPSCMMTSIRLSSRGETMTRTRSNIGHAVCSSDSTCLFRVC